MGDRSRFGVAAFASNRLSRSLHRCAYPLGSWLPCALRPLTHRIGCNPVRALLNLPKCRCSTVPISNAIAKMYTNCGVEPILAVIRKQETRTSGNGRLGRPHCGLRQISTFQKFLPESVAAILAPDSALDLVAPQASRSGSPP